MTQGKEKEKEKEGHQLHLAFQENGSQLIKQSGKLYTVHV